MPHARRARRRPAPAPVGARRPRVATLGVSLSVLLGLIASPQLASAWHFHGSPSAAVVDPSAAADGDRAGPVLPALRLELTAAGTTSLVNDVLPVFMDNLPEFDDIIGKEEVFLVGELEYRLTSIEVTDPTVGNVDVGFREAVGVRVADGSLKMACNWEFKKTGFPYIPRGSGTLTASLTRGSVDTDVLVTRAEDNRPRGTLSNIQVAVGEVDIDISGSWFSWLYNFLIWVFKGPVVRELTSKLRMGVLERGQAMMDDVFQTFNTSYIIDDVVELHYGLVADPSFPHGSMLRLDFEGDFRPRNDPTRRAPFPRVEFPDPATESRMVAFYFDRYMIQSALWAFHELGLFAFTLDDADLPPDFPVRLHTKNLAWKLLLPKLGRAYPDHVMRIRTASRAIPELSIAGGKLTVEAKVLVDFEVELPAGGGWKSAFALNVDIHGNGRVWVHDHFIHMKIQDAKSSVSRASSTIGDFDTKALEGLVRAQVAFFVIPRLNDHVKEGIPIPSVEGFHLVNPVLELGESYVHVNSDVFFEPPNDDDARLQLLGSAAAAAA